MIDFCNNHNVTLSHSTAYYPQGNGLEESSNKSFVIIIKKLLIENKQSWDFKLVYALWVDRASTKISIGTSQFQRVYGTNFVFPFQLALPLMKFWKEELEEPNEIQRRML
jgi:transposase InsO family protein